jgi:hypothetical protein
MRSMEVHPCCDFRRFCFRSYCWAAPQCPSQPEINQQQHNPRRPWRCRRLPSWAHSFAQQTRSRCQGKMAGSVRYGISSCTARQMRFPVPSSRRRSTRCTRGYESDETGAYDLILGKSVQPGQQAPAGMKRIAIPSARYLVFPANDNSPAAIQAAWRNVYRYFEDHPAHRRAFTYDFEEHSGGGIKIFIAIK